MLSEREGRRLQRDLVERLRDRGGGHINGMYDSEAADEIERLRAALLYAAHGFRNAYAAAEKRFNDEVLMHCGHHEAQAVKALEWGGGS